MDLNNLITQDIQKGNSDVAKYIVALHKDASNNFLKQQRDWYINERFARGDHWVVYNKTLNKVQSLPTNSGEVRRTVNKIKSQIRGVKNFIKRNQPRWEVHPDDTTNESFEDAKKKNKIVQNIYRTRKIPRLLTDQIVNALKYSVGIIEGGVIDKEGKQYLDFWVDDTFDIVFDPMATSVDNCRFIIKAVKKPVSYIKKKYDMKTVVSDNKEASSSYKELLEQEKYNKQGSESSSGDLDSIIIYELVIKYIDQNDKPKVRVITSSDKQVLKVSDPHYRRYPFFTYNPEKTGNSIYSEPWIKDLISLNKSLDKTVSQVESYIQRMLGGKYLIKQGVEVSSITDGNAEKIYYKGSVPPIQQNLQPLPNTPFTYMDGLERWIEELGGMRESSLGRAPGSVQSGKGIEALQNADAKTVAEPIENLELMLEEMAEFILEVIEDYQIVSEEIIEEGEKIKYIGNVEDKESIPEGAVQIKASKVKVVIVPEISYDEENKREWALRLSEAGLIDQETLLEKFNISNIGEIIDRMNVKKKEEFNQEMMKQKESHRTSGNAPEDSADLADQENMQMAAKQEVPMTPQVLWTPEHTELHMSFIQQNADAYNQAKQLFDTHIQNEEQYQQQ